MGGLFTFASQRSILLLTANVSYLTRPFRKQV